MTQVIAAHTQVLADYRAMRRAGMPPHHAMAAVRHVYADRIAAAAARCLPMDTAAVACWQAADEYAQSMLHRPAYWFRPAL